MDTIEKFDGDYRFLSNFHPVPIILDDVVYPTVENAFQAAKTLDKDMRLAFLFVSPGTSKRLGRNVELRADWQDVKLSIMHDLLKQKFTLPDLRVSLLATGDATLIEGNDWDDIFWGVCRGVGENHLGKLLMQVRTEI